MRHQTATFSLTVDTLKIQFTIDTSKKPCNCYIIWKMVKGSGVPGDAIALSKATGLTWGNADDKTKIMYGDVGRELKMAWLRLCRDSGTMDSDAFQREYKKVEAEIGTLPQENKSTRRKKLLAQGGQPYPPPQAAMSHPQAQIETDRQAPTRPRRSRKPKSPSPSTSASTSTLITPVSFTTPLVADAAGPQPIMPPSHVSSRLSRGRVSPQPQVAHNLDGQLNYSNKCLLSNFQTYPTTAPSPLWMHKDTQPEAVASTSQSAQYQPNFPKPVFVSEGNDDDAAAFAAILAEQNFRFPRPAQANLEEKLWAYDNYQVLFPAQYPQGFLTPAGHDQGLTFTKETYGYPTQETYYQFPA